MNPFGNNKIFISVISALALSLVLAAIHWVVMHNVIEVCYTLDAPGGRTQVYWDTGSGFNEENTRMTVDHSGPGPAYFCFSSVWMRGVRAIRIDPIDYAGGFDISAIELAYKDVIFPFQFINRFELETSAAILEGVIRGPGGSTQFQSSGGDPTLTWAVPMKRTGGISLLLVTIGLLGVVVLAITFLSLRGIRSPGCLVSLLPLLLIYPIYLLFALLSDMFGSFIRFADYALWLSLVVAALIVLIPRKFEWTLSGSIATVVVIASLFVVSFDVIFRLGLVEKPVFMMGGNHVYHWRLGQSPDQNLNHSSMRYYGDFDILSESMESQTAFLSDLATSYYVAAATSLSATNVHMHHDKRAGFFAQLVEDICNADQEAARMVIDDLVQENRRRRRSDSAEVRYLLVNRDDVNQNVTGNCLQRNQSPILSAFGDHLRLLTAGEYIDAYEIVFEQ